MIRAGKLDRVAEIQRATTSVDAAGTVTSTWATIATVRAHLVETLAEEIAKAYGMGSERTIVLQTCWRAGIALADRVLLEGQAFDIKELREIGRRRHMEIRCERVGP